MEALVGTARVWVEDRFLNALERDAGTICLQPDRADPRQLVSLRHSHISRLTPEQFHFKITLVLVLHHHTEGQTCTHCMQVATLHFAAYIQGDSNMTGTNYDLFTHK